MRAKSGVPLPLKSSLLQPGSIAGVVLAGGRSRRMGGIDKAMLLLGGRPMLAIVIDRMRPQVDALAVSANGDVIGNLGLDLPILADAEFRFEGPLAGLLAGLRWARREVPSAIWMATAAIDTPFLPSNLVHSLLMASPQSNVTRLAASRGSMHPVFGLWPMDIAPALEDWLAGGSSRKVSDWVGQIPHVIVEFEEVDGSDPFFNVNTPDDARVARLRLSETAS